MERYAKNAGAIFSLKVHLVWCPKYRRKVLVNGVDERLKTLLLEKSQERGFVIHAMEVMPDHVHLFLEHDPTYGVAEIVNRLKGYTSRILRSEFPWLRSRIPTLWSRSYFAGSVGSVTATAVQKYIEDQKGK
jgi:putative transposase